MLRLASGAALGQLIVLLAAPLLTRLYTPEAFGIATVFASVVGVLGVLACMRYELTIVLPKEDREAANLLGLSLLSLLLLTVLLVVAMYLWGAALVEWLRIPELHSYLWVVPVMVFFSGTFTALSFWNIRTQNFSHLAIARLTSQVGTTSGSLGAGAAGHASAETLILASVSGQALATLLLARLVFRDYGKYIIDCITVREIWGGVKRYKKFPTLNGISALVNIVSTTMPIFFLGIFFSPAFVGFYALAQRILGMPLSLVGNAISEVFLPQAVDARHRGDLPSLLLSTFDKLILLGTLPLLCVTIYAVKIVTFAFGENWAEAGEVVQVLIPWFYVNFIGATFTKLVVILERQEVGLYYNVVLLIARFVMLSIGAWFGSALLAVGLSALSGAMLLFFLCVYLVHLAGLSWRALFRIMRFHALASVIATAIVGLLQLSEFGEPMKLAYGISVIALLYLTLIVLREPRFIAYLLSRRVFRRVG